MPRLPAPPGLPGASLLCFLRQFQSFSTACMTLSGARCPHDHTGSRRASDPGAGRQLAKHSGKASVEMASGPCLLLQAHSRPEVALTVAWGSLLVPWISHIFPQSQGEKSFVVVVVLKKENRFYTPPAPGVVLSHLGPWDSEIPTFIRGHFVRTLHFSE